MSQLMRLCILNAEKALIFGLIMLIALAASFTQAEELYFVHTDNLGTPRIITDSGQNTVWEGRSSPFGETEIVIEQLEFNVRFPGQYSDLESKLSYSYYRDYDPSLGRYVQSDPIGILEEYSDPQLQLALASGVLAGASSGGYLNHLYGYANQNPLRFTDPFGLSPNFGGDSNGSRFQQCSDDNKNKKKDDCGYLTKIGKVLGGYGRVAILVCRLLSKTVDHDEPGGGGSPKPPQLPPKPPKPPATQPKDPEAGG